MPSKRHGRGQSQGKQASAAETILPEERIMQSEPAADCTLDVNQNPAGVAVPHGSYRNHDWSTHPDNQHASVSGKGGSQPALVEGLHHADTALIEEPGVPCQQPQMSRQELPNPAEQEPPSGVFEMPHNALEARGPREARTLSNAALVDSSAEGAGQRSIAENGIDRGEGEHQAGQDMHSAGGAQSNLAEGAQQGIIQQVMDLMSPELPISSAMQRAAGLVEQDRLTRKPRWVCKRRRGQSKADRYSWRKAGRGWRRCILRKRLE